jgi:hypothetical protein
MDVELFCGDHVSLDSEPQSYFVECPEHGVSAIVAIDGRAV